MIFLRSEVDMQYIFDTANAEDTEALIQLRIAYMLDDFKAVSNNEMEILRHQLSNYFTRKLNSELIAFVARDEAEIVAVAYLHIIEMPASVVVPNGLYGEVLNVYTQPEHRGNGLCSSLMQRLVDYGKGIGLSRIDLSATAEGYPIYKKIGFNDLDGRYSQMRILLQDV